jgi:hypothetical protein
VPFHKYRLSRVVFYLRPHAQLNHLVNLFLNLVHILLVDRFFKGGRLLGIDSKPRKSPQPFRACTLNARSFKSCLSMPVDFLDTIGQIADKRLDGLW